MTAWIIIYIILGILTFLLLKKETKTNQLTAIENIFTFLITVLLFPISIILLVKNKIKPSALNKKHKVNLFNEQINIVRTFTKHSKNEINDESLNKSILDFQKGNFIYDISLKRLIESVEYFLTTGKEPPKEPDGSGVQKDGTIVMYQTVRVGWFFAMTNEFMKSIHNIDRKIQGRILEALEEISKNPVELKGDTVKPLKGNLNGLWRYRIGDFRLVYQPDQKNKQIILHTFSSRGGVYE